MASSSPKTPNCRLMTRYLRAKPRYKPLCLAKTSHTSHGTTLDLALHDPFHARDLNRGIVNHQLAFLERLAQGIHLAEVKQLASLVLLELGQLRDLVDDRRDLAPVDGREHAGEVGLGLARLYLFFQRGVQLVQGHALAQVLLDLLVDARAQAREELHDRAGLHARFDLQLLHRNPVLVVRHELNELLVRHAFASQKTAPNSLLQAGI